MTQQLILSVKNLTKKYPVSRSFFSRKQNYVHAVNNVSFDLEQGTTLGLVGESGCGKSTLGRVLLRLIEPSEGSILFDNKDLLKMDERALRALRRNFQFVFQDPYASLNPRMTVAEILEEPLSIHFPDMDNQSKKEIIKKTLEDVGLHQSSMEKYAHEFSGGQRQRIGIARAIILKPQLLIADEPVSALDVSVQSQIINLFNQLKLQMNLSLIFIAHDLSVVAHVSDRVAVMYLGNLVEIAPTTRLFSQPSHPYTQGLLHSIPNINVCKKRLNAAISGDLPSPMNPPTGCPFHTRCSVALDVCRVVKPELIEVDKKHYVACHLYKSFSETSAK